MRALPACLLLWSLCVGVMAAPLETQSLEEAERAYDQWFEKFVLVEYQEAFVSKTRRDGWGEALKLLGSEDEVRACGGLEAGIDRYVDGDVRAAMAEARQDPRTRAAFVPMLAGVFSARELQAISAVAPTERGPGTVMGLLDQHATFGDKVMEAMAASPLGPQQQSRILSRLMPGWKQLESLARTCARDRERG
jgi:hypothetical protein